MPGWFEELSYDLGAAWAIAQKDMKIYYLRSSILVSSLLFPFVMFLAFAIGRNAPSGVLIPGLLAAPVSVGAIVLGASLSGALFASAIGVATTVIGLIALRAGLIHIVALLVGLVLTSLCFSTMGTLFAAYRTENVGEVMSLLNLVRLPLLFISGIFIPIGSMPAWGQSIALFSPLTYAHDLILFAFDGTTLFGPAIDAIVLVLAIIIFQVTGVFLYRRSRE